jgi:hypothetical protein
MNRNEFGTRSAGGIATSPSGTYDSGRAPIRTALPNVSNLLSRSSVGQDMTHFHSRPSYTT